MDILKFIFEVLFGAVIGIIMGAIIIGTGAVFIAKVLIPLMTYLIG